MEGMMGGILKNQVQGKMKDTAKDVKFKSVYTWARISGFVCTLIVLGMVFNQTSTPGCMAVAIVGALLALFCEVVCCFKCCSGTKACATKVDKILSYGPFFKGSLYLVIAVIGFVVYHFEVAANGTPNIAVVFDFILFLIPGIMYILAFIIMDKCKLRKPDDKTKGAGASDIEEQADPSATPHEYVKKNIFSKACKVCGQPNEQACMDAQAAAAAAAAAGGGQKANPFEKMRGSFTAMGARMSNGFKELGAKMKIGAKSPTSASPSGGGGGGGGSARNSVRGLATDDPAEENPFAKRSSSKATTKAVVRDDVEENPFL